MNKFNQLTKFQKAMAVVLSVFMILLPMLSFSTTVAKAQTSEIVYCDEDDVYNGTGQHVSDSFQIVYDQIITYPSVCYYNVPSFLLNDNSLTNPCATLGGANIIAFYDRFYPELIPDYEPGGISPYGFYFYYGDKGLPQTNNVVSTLHTLMNSWDGTTEAEFTNGMQSYLAPKGRTMTYTSIKTSSTTVDLTALDTMVAQNKIGIIMCSRYNYVGNVAYSQSTSTFYVAKHNSQVGHMMVVYGYEYYDLIVDGVTTRYTFLRVCSGYADGDVGYVMLNDNDLTLQQAYVVNIT